MQRQRGELVPIGEALAKLSGQAWTPLIFCFCLPVLNSVSGTTMASMTFCPLRFQSPRP